MIRPKKMKSNSKDIAKSSVNSKSSSNAEVLNKKELEDRRNKLISEIKPKLLSNMRLRMGGSDVRSKYSQEVSAFTPALEEINEIGKKLGKPPIGLGHLRSN